MCAHLWNWLVRKAPRHKRRKKAPKRYPQAVVSTGTASQTKIMKGTATRLLLPLVSIKSWWVIPLGYPWDTLGIHVVLAEGTDEVRTYDRGLRGAEIVRQEVDEPGEKVGRKVGQDRQ
jgi:hypothetical protein